MGALTQEQKNVIETHEKKNEECYFRNALTVVGGTQERQNQGTRPPMSNSTDANEVDEVWYWILIAYLTHSITGLLTLTKRQSTGQPLFFNFTLASSYPFYCRSSSSLPVYRGFLLPVLVVTLGWWAKGSKFDPWCGKMIRCPSSNPGFAGVLSGPFGFHVKL